MKREAGKMCCVGFRPIIHLSTMWNQHFTNEKFILFFCFNDAVKLKKTFSVVLNQWTLIT